MPAYPVSVAAATAVVGYDLFTNQIWKTSDVPRHITGLAFMGSAAALDTIADLYVNTVKVATFYNRTTGYPNMDDMIPLDVVLLAGAQVSLVVTDAAATNPINAILQIDDLV